VKYANAYIAGVGVGLVLLATFVITGHGLSFIGAFSFNRWIAYELLGVMLGGAFSAALAGRLHFAIDRGPRASSLTRLTTAAAGGVAMGIGAKLARGCTSGLALSGGAVLSVAGWLFIVCAFAAGYALIPITRRLWT
jgi:uncharacterized protein